MLFCIILEKKRKLKLSYNLTENVALITKPILRSSFDQTSYTPSLEMDTKHNAGILSFLSMFTTSEDFLWMAYIYPCTR